MTDPGPGAGPGPETFEDAPPHDRGGSSTPAASETGTAGPPSLGLFRFTIEGRQAPGLYVAGWLATLVGGGFAIVGVLAGQTLAGGTLWVVGTAVAFGGLLLLGGSQAFERRAAGLDYAGPSPILVFATWIVGLFVAVAIVGTPLNAVGVRIEGPALALMGVAIQAIVVFIVLRLLVVGTGALTWREMGLDARSGGVALRDAAWGAVFAMPVAFVTVFVVAGLVMALGESPEGPLPPAGDAIGLAVNLVTAAVIAPLYEELLFRGFATTAWARMVPVMSAVIRTSVLFAVAHILTLSGEDFEQGLRLALIGAAGRLPVALALGWVFVRRRSLWASVGLHAAFNAVLLILAETAIENLPAG